jgi:hypothetical protein
MVRPAVLCLREFLLSVRKIMQEEVLAREAARAALEQLTDVLGARHGSRQHRILEGPTVEALARARPASLAALRALTRIPRFSKNKRTLYGADIVVALQQVRPPPACSAPDPALQFCLNLLTQPCC